jgi:hypothetical protein
VAGAAGLDPGWRPEQVAPDGYRRLARLLEPKEVCR